jgi:hypothetical protein
MMIGEAPGNPLVTLASPPATSAPSSAGKRTVGLANGPWRATCPGGCSQQRAAAFPVGEAGPIFVKIGRRRGMDWETSWHAIQHYHTPR